MPSNNNIILTKSQTGATPSDGRQTILIGSERVDVGINSGNKEIAVNKESGLRYERDAMVGKTIYNVRNQQHKCFFVIALETGRGTGKSWYPGSIRVADIKEDNTEVKHEPSASSETVITLAKSTVVKILDLEYDTEQNIWYKIQFNSTVGFIRNIAITNIRYVDPD